MKQLLIIFAIVIVLALAWLAYQRMGLTKNEPMRVPTSYTPIPEDARMFDPYADLDCGTKGC